MIACLSICLSLSKYFIGLIDCLSVYLSLTMFLHIYLLTSIYLTNYLFLSPPLTKIESNRQGERQEETAKKVVYCLPTTTHLLTKITKENTQGASRSDVAIIAADANAKINGKKKKYLHIVTRESHAKIPWVTLDTAA